MLKLVESHIVNKFIFVNGLQLAKVRRQKRLRQKCCFVTLGACLNWGNHGNANV